MPHIDSHRRRPATAVLVLLLTSLVLAACGSSSKSPSSSASTTTSASTATTPLNKAGIAGRFTQIRECLQKNGVTLPRFTPGQRPRGLQLPKGMTRAQYEAALKKCGVRRGGPGAGASRLNNPAYKATLVKFAACMRQHGVPVSEPNTSGKGPIFNTTGINTSSAQFKAASASCIAGLRGALPGLAGGA
jgi:hypothetical protein